jgi:hypothetical protein
MDMAKILMIYQFPAGNSSIRISFNRELFPYKIQSHFGKYSRKTTGVLQEYEKIIKSVILFEETYLLDVKRIVEKYSIQARFFKSKEI